MSDIVECKNCHKKQLKITSSISGKNKLYRNESGELWNGKQCSECNRERLRLHMKEKRALNKTSLNG